MKERDFIERLEEAFPDLRREDDAAMHRVDLEGPPGRRERILTLSTDAAVEGVHFDRRISTLSQAVQKLVTSNVSDIYAMGGEPEELLFTAGFPEGCDDGEAAEIVEGLGRAVEFYGVRLAGGDTVRSAGGYFFNISIVGAQRHSMPVERSGARPGELLVLFGECGGSLLGMELLRHLCGIAAIVGPPRALLDSLPAPGGLPDLLPRLRVDTDGPGIGLLAGGRGKLAEGLLALAKRHLVPDTLPVEPALLGAAPPLLTAMIDVSDGLARDLRNLCRASGVGAVVREELIPVPQALSLFLDGESGRAVDYALSSGEEYVMLAACREAPPAGRVIGEIVTADEGLTLIGRGGTRRELPETGYEHTF